jgi:hypothetical protein
MQGEQNIAIFPSISLLEWSYDESHMTAIVGLHRKFPQESSAYPVQSLVHSSDPTTACPRNRRYQSLTRARAERS